MTFEMSNIKSNACDISGTPGPINKTIFEVFGLFSPNKK